MTNHPQWGIRAVARHIGCDHTTVLNTLYRHPIEALTKYQEIIAPKVVSHNHFNGDGIITADHHNPCADLYYVECAIEEGKKHKIRTLYDVGDFFNFDALSNYARKIGGDDKLPKLTDELDFGYGVLKLYSSWFDKIFLCIGNHEGRYAKALSNALSYSEIVKAFELPKVKVIEDNYIIIDGIRFSHPRSYSQIKLSVARRLTEKFMMPTYMAHGHFADVGFASNGLRCGDIGCMCDPDRIQYLQGGDTTHPHWNKGFLIFEEGQIYMRAKGYGIK